MKSILFNTDELQAILDGRKTQTRRGVKARSYIVDVEDGVFYVMTEDDSQPIKCPYGKVGDILWVNKDPRLFLRIKSIRVERLHDISEDDAKEEGVSNADTYKGIGVNDSMANRYAFKELWISINGSGSWDANPWVWVIEFERIEKPKGGAE